MGRFPALLDLGAPLATRLAFQRELLDYVPLTEPVLRHIDAVGSVSGFTGVELRSLRASDGAESKATFSKVTGRADVWLSVFSSSGAVHFLDAENDLDLGSVSRLAWTVGSAAWGGALNVAAADATNEGGEIVLLGAASNNNWHVDTSATLLRFHHGSAIYFSMAPGGSTTISQRTTDSGLPVQILEQLDVDDTFVNFIGDTAADGTKSISSDTSEDASKFGAYRVEINGTTKWVRVYDDES